METSIIFSGFGGQGALFAGQVLTYAALDEGKHTTWIPSYGPEMRGGTARCTVIISDEEIGSPIVLKPDIAVAMNLPSLDFLEPLMKIDGLLIANKSLIDREFERDDVNSIFVPAQEIAEDIGEKRMLNMVMVGALLAINPVLPIEAAQKALSEHIAERHKHTLPMNFVAMEKGAELARSLVAEKV